MIQKLEKIEIGILKQKIQNQKKKKMKKIQALKKDGILGALSQKKLMAKK